MNHDDNLMKKTKAQLIAIVDELNVESKSLLYNLKRKEVESNKRIRNLVASLYESQREARHWRNLAERYETIAHCMMADNTMKRNKSEATVEPSFTGSSKGIFSIASKGE